MKKIKLKAAFLAVALMACQIVGVGKVFADDTPSSTMTVSPPNQRIILIPGEKYKGTINISNPSGAKQNLDYTASVGSFSQSKSDDSKDDYGDVDTATQTSYNQMMDWISFENNKGSVAPNSTESLVFVINVPKDAPAGGQYATILIQDDTDYNEGGNGNVSIQSVLQFAAIIYAEVAGETRDEGVITENNIPSLLLSNPLTATSMVRNNGNIHTDVEYTFQVWPLFSDEEICTNEENVKTSLVLPETEKYQTQTCNLPMVGIFRAKQVVKIFDEVSTVEKIVFICPVWLMFVVIFAIVALIIWIVIRVRMRKKARE